MHTGVYLLFRDLEGLLFILTMSLKDGSYILKNYKDYVGQSTNILKA